MVNMLSYEDLYELLRAEKSSADLEKLTLNDLTKITSYFKAKEDLLKRQEVSTAFFSTKARVKIQLEIDNAMQMLRDLFERREAKVINRAVFSIRSGSKLKDTTNMLEHEENLYNALLDLLSKNRKAFFDLIEKQKAQIITVEPEVEKEIEEEQKEEEETP